MKHKAFFRPRKRFGQNFLQDPLIIQRIIDSLHAKPEDRIVEIGPGLGALTKPLLAAIDRLEVIELDRDLANQLQNHCDKNKLIIHTEDALKFDFSLLQKAHTGKKLRVVGNLPYNISTPLIFHLLKFAPLIEDMHFMLQKEVVDRIEAKPKSKEYGRLSIMVQYYCKAYTLFTVGPEAFYPKPKVHSSFIRLIPYETLPAQATDLELLKNITRAAFNQRRKTLANALKEYLMVEDYKGLNLDPTKRPEELSVTDYVRISNFISHSRGQSTPL